MGATERIAELLQTLPEREVAEVLDFAEYLAARRLRNQETDGNDEAFRLLTELSDDFFADGRDQPPLQAREGL